MGRSLEEIILQELEGEMSSVYDCTRDWEAWLVGTMRESDFSPIQDRLVPIVHSLANAVRSRLSPVQGEELPELLDAEQVLAEVDRMCEGRTPNLAPYMRQHYEENLYMPHAVLRDLNIEPHPMWKRKKR